MARSRIIPETHACPVCGTEFEVGGRGRRPRSAIYCSRRCAGVATYGNLPEQKGTHAPRPKKNRDTLHNEAWLRARYLDEQMSMDQIAAQLDCSKQAVQWALRKFAIPIRSASAAKRGRPSHVVWTPEMRARQTEANHEMWASRPRENLGRRGVNYDPDPRMARVRGTRAYRKGVDGPTYDAMLSAQGGVCAACGKPETKRHRSGSLFTLSVDHSHATGKVRALMCNNCNAALGLLKENPATLRALIAYLETHS